MGEAAEQIEHTQNEVQQDKPKKKKRGILKKLFYAWLTIGTIIGIAKMGGDANVAMVKSGILEMNKTLTLGEAFQNYKYFKSVKWESDKSANGIELVNAYGEIDFSKFQSSSQWTKQGIAKMTAIFQFTVNKDGKTFQFHTLALKATSTKGEQKVLDAKQLGMNAFGTLGALSKIYKNEPLQ